jgi:hypothetical protein
MLSDVWSFQIASEKGDAGGFEGRRTADTWQADRRGCRIDEEGRANRVAEWTVEIRLLVIKGFWKRCNSHLGWEFVRR